MRLLQTRHFLIFSNLGTLSFLFSPENSFLVASTHTCTCVSDQLLLLVLFVIFKFRFSFDSQNDVRTWFMSAADQVCQKSARILTLTTSARLLRLFPCRYGVLAVKRSKEWREQRPSQWVLWNLEILENLKRVVQVLQTHQQTDPNKREIPKPCATSSTKKETCQLESTFFQFRVTRA